VPATVPSTLGTLLDEFMREHAEKKLDAKTIERYREQNPTLLAMPLAEIGPLHLSREWNRLLESGGHHRRTKQPRPLLAKTVRNIAGGLQRIPACDQVGTGYDQSGFQIASRRFPGSTRVWR